MRGRTRPPKSAVEGQSESRMMKLKIGLASHRRAIGTFAGSGYGCFADSVESVDRAERWTCKTGRFAVRDEASSRPW